MGRNIPELASSTRKIQHVAQLCRASLLTRCISQSSEDASLPTRHNFSKVFANLALAFLPDSRLARISFSARRIRSLSSGEDAGIGKTTGCFVSRARAGQG